MEKEYNFVNRSIRLKGYDYNLPGTYFITICLKNRKCLFGEIVQERLILNNLGMIAEKCWVDIPNHFKDVETGPFVIMPNHMHGIIFILDDGEIKNGQRYIFDLQDNVDIEKRKYSKLSVVLGTYKAGVTRDINKLFPKIKFKWQTSFHDHIIRNEKEMENIANYIELNPARWNEDFENEKFREKLTDNERKNLLKEVYKSFI